MRRRHPERSRSSGEVRDLERERRDEILLSA
jgi:hypothetical protein